MRFIRVANTHNSEATLLRSRRMTDPALPSRCRAPVALAILLLAAGPRALCSTPRTLAPLAFHDLAGRRHTTECGPGQKATVYLFLSVQCPISRRYGSRLTRLAREFEPRGVRWFGVNPCPQESVTLVRQDAAARHYPFPLLKDDTRRLVDALGATVTPEAIVTDRSGVIRYRGRIDDSADGSRISSHDLRVALEELLAGRPVSRPQTTAIGCAIPRPAAPLSTSDVTFTADVAPLLQKSCQSCHRPGQVGPFPLLSYKEAVAHAPQIKQAVLQRRMPPWQAAPGFGELADEQRLSDREIRTLARWIDAGMPLGDPRRLPPPRKFDAGWQAGMPDRVLDAGQAYDVPSDGRDVYRNFVLEYTPAKDEWVTAVEVAPDQRAVVHHVILYADPSGQTVAMDRKDPGPGFTVSGSNAGFEPAYWIAGWAVGGAPAVMPQGTAARLPVGSRLVMQVHYHPDGLPHRDRTRIGLSFARGPIDKRMRVTGVLPLRSVAPLMPDLTIPPGVARHRVTAALTVPHDITVIDVSPHMHMLGREMKVTATLPDGTVKPLVWVPRWQFNWQQSFRLKQPLRLPGGSRVELVAYYDNSPGNRNNPNRPPRLVTWGPQTTDEMCIAFLSYTLDSEQLSRATPDGSPLDMIEIR
jgi:hypothetical protein